MYIVSHIQTSMLKKKAKWKLIDKYPIMEYQCGIRAGDRVRLRQEIVIFDHRGKPTGEIHHVGEIWTVLSGAAEPPIVVWLRQPDGERHTWDDEPNFWDWFERVNENPD
jgi:hypothetical protein